MRPSYSWLAPRVACADSVVVIAPTARLVLLAGLVLASCRDAASSVFPETPLGQMGRDWLVAHNRANGHAIVHFTMVNRGTAPINGAQTDSAVDAGVTLARRLGPLVAVKVLQSSDSLLAVLLRSADTSSSTWAAPVYDCTPAKPRQGCRAGRSDLDPARRLEPST